MKLSQFIDKLQDLINTKGVSPDAEVVAYDGDIEDQEPVTGLDYSRDQVEILTDSDDEEIAEESTKEDEA